MKRVPALVAVLSVASLVAVGCSSSDSPGTGSTSAPPSSASESSSSASVDPGLAAAQKYLEERLPNPTSILIDTPLSKKPEPGKLIVKLRATAPINQAIADATEDAAKVLGWDFKDITIEPTAEGMQQAFQSALQLSPKPDGIEVSGYPTVTYQALLEQAVAEGIVVIADSTTDTVDPEKGLSAVLDGAQQQEIWGRDIASYVAVDSEGKANVALFTVPSFSILDPMITGFTEGLAEYCPACTVKVVDQQATDAGTKTPQSVVSTLQSDPSINYIFLGYGDLGAGVPAALSAAGLEDQAKIVGGTVSLAGLQALRDGTEYAWTGLSADQLGWRTVDAFARLFNGDEIPAESEQLLPSQIMTQENIDSVVLGPGGFYSGVAGFEEQFKKLWLVS